MSQGAINSNELSPFLYIENDMAYLSNGDIAIGYFLELPEKYSLSEQDYQDAIEIWYKGIKNLSFNTVVIKQDLFLTENYNAKFIPGEHFLRKYTRSYFDKRQYTKHICLIFFVLPIKKTFFNGSIKNPFVPPKKKKYTQWESSAIDFSKDIESITEYLKNQSLGQNKIGLNRLREDDYKWYHSIYFNGFQSDYHTDFNAKEKEHIEIGNQLYGMLALTHEKDFPEYIQSSIRDENYSSGDFLFFKNYGDSFSIDLKCNHVYTQILFIDDPKSHLEEVKKNHTSFKQARSFSPENKYFAQKLEETVNELVDNQNYHICRGHNSIMYWADDRAELQRIKNEIVSNFRQMDFKPYFPTGNNRNFLFAASFFAYASTIPNRFLYYTDMRAALSLFNNTTNFKNNEEGILLNDRINNLPLTVDTWDEKKNYVNARNFFIIAPTGSGKSFLANHLFSQFYEQNTTLVIVDLGGSYKKLAALYPNETVYVRYQEGKSLNLNPFHLDADEIISSEKIKTLGEFVLLHTHQNTTPNQEEVVSLRNIIKYYYENQNTDYTFPNFIHFLKEKGEDVLRILNISPDFFNLTRYNHLLQDYVNEGIYAFLYKQENDQRSQIEGKKFVVFELDEAKDNELLLSVLIQLIAITIEKIIWQDISSRGIIFFDEAAKQLEFPSVLNRIKYINATIRKYNGAIGLALQTINQFPNNETGKSIIENTQVLYVLRSDRGYNDIKERFKLTEHNLYQMRSINDNFKASEPYSEIFVLRGKYANVYRLQTPPEVFWAYQTEGNKNKELMNIYQQEKDMEKAILTYLNK